MNTKIIVTLVIVAVLAIAVVGLGSALTTPTLRPIGTNQYAAQNGGFFGGMGRCYGFGTQAALCANITVTNPNTGQTSTCQGYYPCYPNLQQNTTAANPYNGYGGYGYCGCMRGFNP